MITLSPREFFNLVKNVPAKPNGHGLMETAHEHQDGTQPREQLYPSCPGTLSDATSSSRAEQTHSALYTAGSWLVSAKSTLL